MNDSVIYEGFSDFPYISHNYPAYLQYYMRFIIPGYNTFINNGCSYITIAKMSQHVSNIVFGYQRIRKKNFEHLVVFIISNLSYTTIQ